MFILIVLLVAAVNLVLGFVGGSLFGFGPCSRRLLSWFSPEISGPFSAATATPNSSQDQEG